MPTSPHLFAVLRGDNFEDANGRQVFDSIHAARTLRDMVLDSDPDAVVEVVRLAPIHNLLPNGARVLDEVRINNTFRVVLARYGREFVVWSVDNEGNAEAGRYFDNIVAAALHFGQRRADFGPTTTTQRTN